MQKKLMQYNYIASFKSALLHACFLSFLAEVKPQFSKDEKATNVVKES